jgi:hemolysin III
LDRNLSKDGSSNVTDEVWNTITHLGGTVFSLLGVVLLLVLASTAKKPWHIVSFAIYGTALFTVFLSSTLHHGVKASPKIEEILKQMDYIAIFPLIAGTYTPLCLVMSRNPVGWSIFGVIWAVAAAGITIKAMFPDIPKWVTNTLYVSQGWVGAILVFLLWSSLQWHGFMLIAAGGLFYTVGSFIFYLERPNPLPGVFGFHEVWHIFVILGALCHWLVMFFYVLPY